MSNITIVGAGNSGCAHAFVLSSLGHKVRILKTSHSLYDENFAKIEAQGGIYGIDETESRPTKRFQTIESITRDPHTALEDADYVFVLTQSLQHASVARLILPHISRIKALLIVPGNMGSMFFRPHLNPDILIAEGESTVIDARISEPGVVNILFRNVRNALSFNPACDSDKGLKIFRELVDTYSDTRTNIVETALHNPNLVVHTIGTIMSASRIEMSKGEFWLYREGFSPSIWNLIRALDGEKNDIIRAFGGKPQSYLDCCKYRNEKDLSIDSMEVFNNYAQNGSPKGPDTIHNRYLTEDVPNGLCLLSSLGKVAGVKTPVADSLITIASTLLHTDFAGNCRSVEALGLAGKSKDDIVSLISRHTESDMHMIEGGGISRT